MKTVVGYNNSLVKALYSSPHGHMLQLQPMVVLGACLSSRIPNLIMEKSPVPFGHILLAVDQDCNVSLHLVVCCALLLYVSNLRDASAPMNCEQPMNNKSAPGAMWQVVCKWVWRLSQHHVCARLNNVVQQSCFLWPLTQKRSKPASN